MPPRRAPVVLTAMLVAAVGFETCALVGTDDPESLRSVAASAIGFEVLLGAFAVAVAALLRGGVRDTLGLGPPLLSARELAWLVVGTLAVSHALDAVIDLAGLGEDGALARLDDLLEGLAGGQLLLAAVAFALMPGVCEELLCRGLIQRLACRRLGTLAGIVLASAAFGALHVDAVHALFAGILGLYLGLVCHWSGGVRASIVCHVVNNTAALITAARFPDLAGGEWHDAVLAAAVAGAALWRVGRRRPAGDAQEPDRTYS